MIYPEEFQQLMDNFKNLPGIGDKTAERYVYAIDNLDIDKVESFSNSLINFKNNIKKCSICGHITNKDICPICDSDSRDKSLICVVEDSKSVFMFEKTGKYNGVYHVLGGLISPIDEVNPDDINVNSLINNRMNDKVSEVIIALNPSVEGEMTSLYLQKLLEKNKNVKLSRLSYGIPVGADIEYLDPLTIIRAIDDRKFLS
jgi:recombination protein RecR